MAATEGHSRVMDSHESTESSSDIDVEEQQDVNPAADVPTPSYVIEIRTYELEKRVCLNPYDYEAHLELLKLLRTAGEMVRLRWARERMNTYFALSEALWLEWLDDEKRKLPVNELERMYKLYEQATKECLSVKLWIEYVQYSISHMDRKNGIEFTRALFERAVASVGIHFTDGHKMWRTYRCFENSIATMMKMNVDINEEEEIADQMKRIGNVFRRQLACPLYDMDITMHEYKAWVTNEMEEGVTGVDDDLAVCYERALLKAMKLKSLETRLMSAQGLDKDVFRQYMEYEHSSGELERVQCLYERVLAKFPHDSKLWLEYLHYLIVTFKADNVVLAVMRRSLRNCPWSSPLWQYHLRILERYDKPPRDAKEIMGQGLVVGFSSPKEYRILWQTYLGYLQRRLVREPTDGEGEEDRLLELRKMYREACNYQLRSFGCNGDPNCHILRSWARMEAVHAKMMSAARMLWMEIMSSGHNHSASSWFEYIELEKAHGDKSHVRQLYQEAMELVRDCPKKIGNAWLNFEREEGTLESLEDCERMYRARILKELDGPLYASGRSEGMNQKDARTNKLAKWKNAASCISIPQTGCSGLQPPPRCNENAMMTEQEVPSSSNSDPVALNQEHERLQQEQRLQWNQVQMRYLHNYYTQTPPTRRTSINQEHARRNHTRSRRRHFRINRRQRQHNRQMTEEVNTHIHVQIDLDIGEDEESDNLSDSSQQEIQTGERATERNDENLEISPVLQDLVLTLIDELEDVPPRYHPPMP